MTEINYDPGIQPVEGPTARLLVFEHRADLGPDEYHCAVVFPGTYESREQIVRLDPGRRPGHVLWRERAERRLREWAEDPGKLIPYLLVR